MIYSKKNTLYQNRFNKYINFLKDFILEQIDLALNELMEEPNIILDRYNRKGKLENIGELYIFSPIEVKNDYLKINNRIIVLNKNEEVELPYSINIDEVENLRQKMMTIIFFIKTYKIHYLKLII